MLLLNRRPDRPERTRIVAMAWSIPALTIGLVLPRQITVHDQL